MLIENTLFGIENKIDIAIKRIKEFEQMAYRKEKRLNIEKNWDTGIDYFNWWIKG
ncbi:hypothetical protein FACS189447_07590 [Spirochaetia bacterium]|nr:hypothetical protein FACS189447_07590 [Spirochaetia bacterium]